MNLCTHLGKKIMMKLYSQEYFRNLEIFQSKENYIGKLFSLYSTENMVLIIDIFFWEDGVLNVTYLSKNQIQNKNLYYCSWEDNFLQIV